jgi:alpha-1,3-rhamnosyl/mannosyltransferase
MDLGPRLVVVVDGRFVADHYPGIGRYIFNLCRELPAVAPGCRFHLLVDRRAAQTRFDLQTLSSRGIEIVPEDTVRSLRGQLALGRVCRRLSADVSHTPHLLSAGRLPCASLVTIHDLIPLHPAGRLSTPWRRALYRALLRRALHNATGVLMPSDAAAADLRTHRGVGRDRVWVTPYAAEDRFQSVEPGAVARLRRRLALPERYVLYVGTNKPHKNLAMLVDAWMGVGGGATCLVIAGSADARYSDARRRASPSATSERVRFVGAVPERDLPTLYGGARFVVQPSLAEGFGLPVLEAMACGVPVMCARIPALVEVTGRAAYQFDPTNLRELTEALRRGLTDDALRVDLIARGLARVREFSWARTAALTLDAYVRVARAPGRVS